MIGSFYPFERMPWPQKDTGTFTSAAVGESPGENPNSLN
jgi:hypothetical protein